MTYSFEIVGLWLDDLVIYLLTLHYRLTVPNEHVGWRFGVVVNALVSINEVNLRRARLVLRWVTVSGVQSSVPENLSQYIISHPGQLSLAIPPWVGAMSTSQRAVMPCDWVVKAGMVRERVAGKTVWSPCYHGPSMGSSQNRSLYKCPITYFTLYSLVLLLHDDIFELFVVSGVVGCVACQW